MKHLAGKLMGTALALVLLFGSSGASATTSFDFLFSMDRVSDDRQFFLNLTVDNYGYDRVDLEPILPRVRYVEADLPVILFLANVSGRPVERIVDLRAPGLDWEVVFRRCRVSPNVLFVGIDRDPGPPYGRAWGHWRRNRRAMRLTDADIAGLVQIQIGSRLAGVRPYELARARGRGTPVFSYVAEKKGRPYHAGRRDHRGDRRQGKGRDRGRF